MSKSDILCFQETHLHTSLEFAFCLHVQGYDFYFSHGSSASAGVCTVIKRSLGVKVARLTNIPGCLLALDLTLDGETLRIINIYALNKPGERLPFFEQMKTYLAGNVMLLGDFNSIVDECDRLSCKIDPTSHILGSILSSSHLVKLCGSHLKTFTYHHPSIASRKSHLDRIYINYDMPRLCSYTQHCSISDHYLVGLFLTRQMGIGPKPWRFLVDLDDPDCCQQVELILSNFNDREAIASCEKIKTKIQTVALKATAFHNKQGQIELKALR